MSQAQPNQALVIRIKPYQYIHVLDQNTNVTRVVVGPASFTRQDHEVVVSGPDPMIMIPPRHYCIIQNPVLRDKKGLPVKIENSEQVRLRHGDEEVRFDDMDMFPLYPGETLYGKVSPLQVVAPNTALRLRAIRDFADRKAGDEWLFKGPGTYKPRVEVQVVEVVKAVIIGPNQALRLKARRETTSSDNKPRTAGEEWLVREEGAYLPNVDEEIRETVSAYVLTEKKALQLEAIATFSDEFGRTRKAGEQWLITLGDSETHIADVNERVIGEVPITTLSSRQYCVVVDPVDVKSGRPQFGKRELRKGEVSFFLRPGERLEAGIQNVHVLEGDEALLLRARDAFEDGKEKRKAGDRWMIYGPIDYVPPVTVDIVDKRKAIPLDVNEGIYVRDITTGVVRAEKGTTYMLKPFEELWNKEVPQVVEELLSKEVTLSKDWKQPGAGESRATSGRDKSRVVTFRTPHNSAVQVFDFMAKKARVVFGPELVMLGPDEQFTVLSLSGDVPKRPHVIRSLSLLLGPDFMTDVVVVETSDHARLSLKLSYNWFFDVDRKSEDASKIFSVPDFVGDACKALASRVRGAVASQTFDDFHKHSARIIREAVFGVESDGSVKNKLVFSSNSLAVTNIDIQSVEPVDSKTRDALQKSVQLAIEITTKSQEASASHEANRREQQARGKLERQKIKDEAEAERSRTDLLSLQAQSAAVESTGQATAEAKARADAAAIEGAAAVKQAELSSEAERIKAEARLARTKAAQEAEIAHNKAVNDLEIKKARDLAQVEASKFKSIVEAIGAETLEAMSRAEGETQARLLEALDLKTNMITDGNSPINLFTAANGLIANH